MNTKRPHLDFFLAPVACPGGAQRYVMLAFGTDGTMWINPAELGIGPQHAAQLARFREPYLLINPGRQQVLINARAVIEVKTDPEWRRQWLNYVERMIKEHKEVRARYESARNN